MRGLTVGEIRAMTAHMHAEAEARADAEERRDDAERFASMRASRRGG